MKAFKHFNPATVGEAIKLLEECGEKAKPIAGGTDLLGAIMSGLVQPDYIVNLKSVPDLIYVVEDSNKLRIGALTSLREIESHRLINDRYAAIAQAAHNVASPQIRNMGTIGGNLLQDVRCWYYRAGELQGPFICLRKGGNVCYAMNGNHRFYHSIFGQVEGCHAASNSDMAVALLAMAAEVKIAGSRGERIVPLEQIYNKTRLKHALEPDEILLEIQVPKLPPGTKSSFQKLRIRKAVDSAIVSVAISAAIDGRVCKNVRITLGGVFPKPYGATKAGEYLNGRILCEETAADAACLAIKDALPLPLNGYKVDMARNLLKRAVLKLIE